MSREWKPGDVAMVAMGHSDTVAIWTGEFWAWSDGTGPYEGVSHCHGDTPARPLVVIDPEDRVQVERLRDLFVNAYMEHTGYKAVDRVEIANATQAALREFANPTPPKPDEPTGLGAVVEDAKGIRWTRVEDEENATSRNPWYPADCEEQPNEYADIEAVRVLSEGVTP